MKLDFVPEKEQLGIKTTNCRKNTIFFHLPDFRESKKFDSNDRKVTKRINITRTRCKSFSRVKLKDDCYYEVIDHITEIIMH